MTKPERVRELAEKLIRDLFIHDYPSTHMEIIAEDVIKKAVGEALMGALQDYRKAILKLKEEWTK